MKKLRIAVIGNGTEGISICNLFKNDPCVEVAGLADLSGELPEVTGEKHNDILIVHTIGELISIDGLEIIFETTGDREVCKKLRELKNSSTEVVESSCLHLFRLIVNRNNNTEARLHSLMQSVDDGVQIVDSEGFITHINQSFVKMSGLSYQELLGRNIYEVMPESPTAKALDDGKPVLGEKYYFKGSCREVSFQVTPLVENDVCCGSVAVYRELTEVKKLLKELRRSRAIIEDIYERLAQSESFPGLVDSDVIPIEHMEQALLRQALTKFGYSVEGKKSAAKALNISLATLYNKLKKYQIS